MSPNVAPAYEQMSPDPAHDSRISEHIPEVLQKTSKQDILTTTDLRAARLQGELPVLRELIECLGIGLIFRAKIGERDGLEPMEIGKPDLSIIPPL